MVGPQDFHVVPWLFDNGASSKIDDVLAEDAVLLHVLPLAVHLKFFWMDKLLVGWVGGWVGGVGVFQDFHVSLSPFFVWTKVLVWRI